MEVGAEGASAATAGFVPGATAATTFLELPAAAWAGSGECTLELEDAGGVKMRVHLKGFAAPDNNICERALKKAILHRKNSLFYKTENGAHAGKGFAGLPEGHWVHRPGVQHS